MRPFECDQQPVRAVRLDVAQRQSLLLAGCDRQALSMRFCFHAQVGRGRLGGSLALPAGARRRECDSDETAPVSCARTAALNQPAPDHTPASEIAIATATRRYWRLLPLDGILPALLTLGFAGGTY